MKKQDSKQRLFEVMSRLDKTFDGGSELNEEISSNIQRKVLDLIGEIESTYETRNSKIITDVLYFNYKIQDVDYNTLYKYVQDIQRKEKESQAQEFPRATQLNAPEDTGVGERPAFNSQSEYMGMYENEKRKISNKNAGQRLIEVMGRLDKTFKPKLNEDISTSQDDQMEFRTDGEYLPITTPIGSEDDRMFVGIVNQGIDSHLEGFTKSQFGTKDTLIGKRRIFNFHKSELPILLRRLEELGTEEALQWKADIDNQDSEESVDESPMFGGQNVSQDTYDELQYDKNSMEDAMGDAFKTPEGYQMKNQANVGDVLNTSDGDKIKVLGFEDNGFINVQVMHSPQTIEHFKKLGVPLKDFKITWSPVQFDSIVGSR